MTLEGLSQMVKALRMAESAQTAETRAEFIRIAEAWLHMANLFPNLCFCGRAAFGMQQLDGLRQKPLCGEHLPGMLVRGGHFQFALANDD
jgi:hypothetical protein